MNASMPPDWRPDLQSYDHILVAFSGGKDSLACLLHLIELGAPRDRIELHHHEVDGKIPIMDWPVTPAYCREVAKAFDLPIYFSGKAGGFFMEMSRKDRPTAEIWFDHPEMVPRHPLRDPTDLNTNMRKSVGGNGPKGTRGKFPQVSANLAVRWCSAYLKIDVFAAMIRNSPRFTGKRTLVITGERAQESKARANYATLEPHRTDLRSSRGARWRHLDHWRPIHGWAESEVWAIIQRHGVVPHPAYQLGWGRLSCRSCIFGSPNQWATLDHLYPDAFSRIETLERGTGQTIHRTRSVTAQAARGTPYAAARNALPALVALGNAMRWEGGPVVVSTEAWQLPAGAYGESTGPT